MKKILLTTMLFSVLSLPAMAGNYKHGSDDGKMCKKHAAHKAEKMIGKMDKDGDGTISIDEHEAYHGRKFHKTDANGDRVLTREEIKDYMAAKKSKWKAKDKHGDRTYND